MTVNLDFDKLNSKYPKIKYGFTKELIQIGANHPEILYDHFDQWEKMLKSDNNIFKWTAIDIIGYLSAIDRNDKVDKDVDELIALLHDGKLITCNHAIFALGRIAKNKPKHKTKIIKHLLSISKDRFETAECKNIATGKVLETLKQFIPDITDNKAAIDFIHRATENTRNATKTKAIRLMKNIHKG
ncbi:MAG: hypothetical protein ACK43K_11790 [Chitinophagales bacterium]|jgi:hypothetical protein